MSRARYEYMGLAWDVWWSGGENTRGFKKLRAGSKRRPSARRGRAQEWARSLARELGAADSSIRHIIGFGATFETWRNFGEDSDIDLDQSGWHRCLVERMTLDIDGVRPALFDHERFDGFLRRLKKEAAERAFS